MDKLKVYYLYKHIRLDTKDAFYIGIGTKNTSAKYKCHIYRRAYLKAPSKRSKFWQNIFCKTNKKITIEILLETTDLEFIKKKEIEFIKMYGRRDLKKGTLVNQTDGGDGCFNRIWTEEQKKTRSILYKNNGPFTGKKHSIKTKKYLALINKDKYKGKKNPFYNKKHTEATLLHLSIKAKERFKNNPQDIIGRLPIAKGSANPSAKKFLCIYENIGYIVHGTLDKFLKEYNLSYLYFRKYLNQKKVNFTLHSRIRKKSLNCLNWEFLEITENQKLKDMKITIVHYKPTI